MEEYRKWFDHFCQSFPINNKMTENPVELEPCDPGQPCLVILFESISKFYDIDVFLTDVFKIYKRYLRVHKIELGSVQRVTVQFAESMEPHLQACIDQGKETARRHRVTDIHIEPHTETQSTPAADTTDKEDAIHKPVETVRHMKQSSNGIEKPELRSRKRVNSAPNGATKKKKTNKPTNGVTIPA